jgi:hypothetical protein
MGERYGQRKTNIKAYQARLKLKKTQQCKSSSRSPTPLSFDINSIINKNKNNPIFSSLKKKQKKKKKNTKLKNMTKNQNQRTPNVSIPREKNEENEGEEGGYFKFCER